MRASRSSSSRTSLSDSAISTPEPALRAHDVDGITRVSQPTWKIELTEAELPFLAGKPSNFVSLRDVVLLVEEFEVPVHSQVLASCSSVFCEMLRDFQGTYSPTDPIYLEGCFRDKKLYQVLQFLNCVYGQPPGIDSVREAESLVRLADEYHCPQLMELALDYLRRKGEALMQVSCDEDNGVLKWALWAQQYNLPDFLAEAEHRILCNFRVLQNDRRLADLSQESLLRIMCGLYRCTAASPEVLAKTTKKEELQAWAATPRGWPNRCCDTAPYRQRRMNYID